MAYQITNQDAFNAGYDAGLAGHAVSANPFSTADVDNFNDWNMGHQNGEYTRMNDSQEWDGLPPDEDWDEENYGDYDDSMDGDFDSAMTSAGFGTDEDYGYYGGDDCY